MSWDFESTYLILDPDHNLFDLADELDQSESLLQLESFVLEA